MPKNILKRISNISVSSLFGMYDYDLDVQAKGTDEEEKIVIFYGDNGSGKSTLLKLAFHMVAPDQMVGHKTFLVKTEFQRLSVKFNDGTVVQAERINGEISGPYELSVKRGKKKKITATVHTKPRGGDSDLHQLVEPALEELDCAIYLLSDDRAIQRAGGSFQKRERIREHRYGIDEISTGEMSMREMEFHYQRGKSPASPEDIAKQLLKIAIERTEDWFRKRVLGSSTRGDSDVNELYTKILKKISETGGDKASDTTKKKVEQRINELIEESKKFSKYGLLPKFDGKIILDIIKNVSASTFNLIVDVLSPYLDSMETKNEAMKDIYERIDTFVTVSGKFYTNKTLAYDLGKGIRITSSSGKALEPEMLSSGERHLLLLFCTSIVTGGSPSILMIDEPEISLNIKWQRMLVDALIQCIGDNEIQFIFSTHSLEILSKHKSRVVKLEHNS